MGTSTRRRRRQRLGLNAADAQNQAPPNVVNDAEATLTPVDDDAAHIKEELIALTRRVKFGLPPATVPVPTQEAEVRRSSGGTSAPPVEAASEVDEVERVRARAVRFGLLDGGSSADARHLTSLASSNTRLQRQLHALTHTQPEELPSAASQPHTTHSTELQVTTNPDARVAPTSSSQPLHFTGVADALHIGYTHVVRPYQHRLTTLRELPPPHW